MTRACSGLSCEPEERVLWKIELVNKHVVIKEGPITICTILATDFCWDNAFT